MNPREIEVLLTVAGDVDVLIFILDEDHKEDYMINLDSPESQNDIKKVFSKLLHLLLQEEIILKLTIAEGYGKTLFKEVCDEYINALNHELPQVRKMIVDELS